ncbi:MAG: hypothetical protein H6581_20020 [Bacteroidia bacterium]|nr:hypothetical protein [Bacteroidia bacterium]
MKFYSVLTKREYQDDKGDTQIQWYKAGFFKETPNGGRYLRLFHQPNESFYVVADGEREEVIQLDE